MNDADVILRLLDVESGYHKKKVIRGLKLEIWRNQITGVIGHNGAGKTTLLRTIFRQINVAKGVIIYRNEEITKVPTSGNKRLGISLVPQGKSVFPNLSVRENLELAFEFGLVKDNKEKIISEIFELFGHLKGRMNSQAITLSGGLKQMLAVGMAFVQRPSLLLLDEPSLGLAPIVVQDLMARIKQYKEWFFTTVILVEQNIRETFHVTDRICVMKMGDIVYDGDVKGINDMSVIIQLF